MYANTAKAHKKAHDFFLNAEMETKMMTIITKILIKDIL